MDVGFENPIFAALEVDYDDVEQTPAAGGGGAEGEGEEGADQVSYTKLLTYYEFDLGLNNVT